MKDAFWLYVRVKNWLRVSLGKERFIGFALLNIHKNIGVDVEALTDRFFKIFREQIGICTKMGKRKKERKKSL